MRLSRLAAAITAVLSAALLSSLPARADFIFDLAVTGNWTGSGSIDFTTASGITTAGVAGFNFHVATGAGSPQDCDLGDINTISWSIDSSDDLSLLLVSNLIFIPFENAVSAIVLNNELVPQQTQCASFAAGGPQTCSITFLGSFPPIRNVIPT